ncbi:hypothetical protein ACVWY3_006950 [Bradyrhizobium sp. USDA 4486]
MADWLNEAFPSNCHIRPVKAGSFFHNSKELV